MNTAQQTNNQNRQRAAEVSSFSAGDSNLPSINNGHELQNLLFNADAMNQLHSLAKVMADSRVTVPGHLQGNQGDCMAICMQAAQWRMNPFSVAQKTHVTQGGLLGYEAQLVNAVVTSIAPIEGRMEFEFVGDWSKILGKVKEMRSEKNGKPGGKYYVADWNKSDEQGLGVTVSATFKGELEPRTVTIMLAQCYPRFSTQWATDPQQQITYVSVKKWARRYCPDVILGVYTPDELEDYVPPGELDVTPPESDRPELEPYPEERFEEMFPTWEAAIQGKKITAEQLIETVSSKALLSEKQKQAVRNVKVPEDEPPTNETATEGDAQ